MILLVNLFFKGSCRQNAIYPDDTIFFCLYYALCGHYSAIDSITTVLSKEDYSMIGTDHVLYARALKNNKLKFNFHINCEPVNIQINFT